MIRLINVFLAFAFFSNCSEGGDKDPEKNVINATAVKNIRLFDIGNRGDGSDLEIRFDQVANESLVGEYRVLILKSTEKDMIDIIKAEAFLEDFYSAISPQNKSYTLTFDNVTTDIAGDLIVEGIPYLGVVLTIPDGVNAIGSSALSPFSNTLILTAPTVVAPVVTDIILTDISNEGNATDLQISFAIPDDESTIDHYKLFVVPVEQAKDFSNDIANKLSDEQSFKIAAIGQNQSVKLTSTFKDVNGDIMVENRDYAIFIQSIINDFGDENALSTEAPIITLYPIDFDIYVSDAGNFNNPPWQILKFQSNGQQPEIFIDTNLNWPQDIVFLEDAGTVLISNLGSGEINIHDAETGEYIGNFATGIAGPTRTKIGPDNLLYVLQWTGTNPVLRYQLDGTFVDKFTSIGVSQSIGLDWDASGNLYVSSFGDKNVQKFDAHGEHIETFISSNLLGSTNIWFEEEDLFVSDYNGTSVKKFNSEGALIGDFMTGLKSSEGIATLPDGRYIIGNGATNSVKMYHTDGSYVRDIVTKSSGKLINPNALVIRER